MKAVQICVKRSFHPKDPRSQWKFVTRQPHPFEFWTRSITLASRNVNAGATAVSGGVARPSVTFMSGGLSLVVSRSLDRCLAGKGQKARAKSVRQSVTGRFRVDTLRAQLLTMEKAATRRLAARRIHGLARPNGTVRADGRPRLVIGLSYARAPVPPHRDLPVVAPWRGTIPCPPAGNLILYLDGAGAEGQANAIRHRYARHHP